MNNIRKHSLFILFVALCTGIIFLSGCEYSSTHESETKLEVSKEDTSSEAETPIEQAAIDINDYLEGDWPDSFHVTYNEADDDDSPNTVFVHFWSNGVNSIDNMDDLIPEMKEYNTEFAKILEDNGITDGHVMIQILVNVEDDDSFRDGTSVLDVEDGEVTYNAYAE